MLNTCILLHEWANTLPAFNFSFDMREIPLNGLYVLFEKGELAHGGKRIVRVGTHTGEGQLPSRLRQHFLVPNKDRSIFRKNIGRAILNKRHDPYCLQWEKDLTSKMARDTHLVSVDLGKQAVIEKEVSEYMRKNFSFAVIAVPDKKARLSLESKLISTLSHCEECQPSAQWLGLHSPKEKIRESGLWLVNELYKEPLTANDLVRLQKFAVTVLNRL